MHCKIQPGKTSFSKTIQEFPTKPETERDVLWTHSELPPLKGGRPVQVNRSASMSVYMTDPLGASDCYRGPPGPTLLEEEHKCNLQGPPTSVHKTEMHSFS